MRANPQILLVQRAKAETTFALATGAQAKAWDLVLNMIY